MIAKALFQEMVGVAVGCAVYAVFSGDTVDPYMFGLFLVIIMMSGFIPEARKYIPGNDPSERFEKTVRLGAFVVIAVSIFYM